MDHANKIPKMFMPKDTMQVGQMKKFLKELVSEYQNNIQETGDSFMQPSK